MRLLMSDTAAFLAFDLGASSGRALLGHWDGQRFDLAELHRFENGPVDVLGSLYWDPLRLWSEIKIGLSRYATTQTAPLMGIGIDTWGVDYGLLDQQGRLLGNPYNYRDPRTDGMLEHVFTQVPREAIFATTGIQFLQINTLYQLAAMVRARDPQLAAASTLLMIPDLFHYWLTGRQAAEYTNATTTQLLACHDRQWARGLVDQLGIPTGLLPEVVAPGTVLGQLRDTIAFETGLQRGIPVIVPATHDTASAVAAVPGLDARSAYISSGTWSLMGVEIPEPIVSARALALNFTNEGGVDGTIRLLKNINGLWLLQEARRQWQREGHAYAWEDLLAQSERAEELRSLIDPDAPEFLRPGDLPGAVRDFCRRTGQPIPASVGAIVRCCLESLALKYRQVLLALEELTGTPIETIRIVGGGCQNRQLCQFTADACGRAVVAGPVEATALGNLMAQTIAAGLLPDIAAGRRALARSLSLEQYEPRRNSDWDTAYSRFEALLDGVH
jgi:rhamnulokinase